MSNYWKDKKVLVTGGGGFIGSHLCEELVQRGAKVISGDLSIGHLKESPLKNKIKFLKINFFKNTQCLQKIKNFDIVMHLAAKVGGIGYNLKYMSDIYIDNLLILSNIVKAISTNKIKNVLLVSSACVYPRNSIIPTPETEGFKDIPEETNEGYGWAKRALEIAGKMLRRQYGTNVAIVRPYNAYGPRDKFDLEQAHVIPALINKVFNTKTGEIEVLGSGKQTRSFLYVKDAVSGMLLSMEKYPVADAVNLGSDEEITIEDLVKMIIKLSGRDVKIKYNKNAPEGYKRRCADITKAKEKLDFKNMWKLEQGLKETIKYYKTNILK
jgi:GDP-L-fucose synthase